MTSEISEPTGGGRRDIVLLPPAPGDDAAAECVKGCREKTSTVGDFLNCCRECAKIFPAPRPSTA